MPGRRSRWISLPSWRSLSASPATLRTSNARFGRWNETRQTFASFIPSWTSTSSRDRGRRGRGQAEDRRPPQHLRGAPQAEVRRAEVVAPLRHAVRLVDAEQRELHARQRLLHGRRVHRLGRDHHQLDRCPRARRPRSAARSFAVRVESMRTIGDAGRLQLAVLILDQREQRRDDQRRALPCTSAGS